LNVLKSHKRVTILTLLQSSASQREIERVTGVDRKTIRRYARESNSPGVATAPASTIAPGIKFLHPGHRLGRNAQSI
jgi:hypothetical protein